MSQYPYSLEKYKNPASNIICSGCGEKRARAYVNNATGERLGDHVSKCERVDSCGYHFTPKMFFAENPEAKPSDFQKWQRVEFKPPPPTDYIDKRLFESTLGFNELNIFHRFLVAYFGQERAFNLIDKYNIGTNTFTKDKFKARLNRTIFWQVDLEGKVRTGQCVKYNAIKSEKTALHIDCKRDKNQKYHNYFCHKESVNFKDFEDKQCLFGEHLINENQTIAVVESEKSAVLSSLFFPQFVWVASCGNGGLDIDKLKVLKGKSVILFPDLNCFNKWTEKSKQMSFCKSVVVSDLLEKVATVDERASGLDLADYLLRLPAPETMPAIPTEPEPASTVATDAPESVTDNCEVVISDPIAIHDTPFWEEIPQISDDEFKEKCEVLDWWNKRLSLFDDNSFLVVDGVFIPDIKTVLIKHVKAIHEDNSSAVLSLKFLEKVKKLIT